MESDHHPKSIAAFVAQSIVGVAFGVIVIPAAFCLAIWLVSWFLSR